jgi:hypothetical protein
MRDLYVRHRPRCRFAQPDFQDPKGRPARQLFSCGCPIYARYEIRDLSTGAVLERFNGSLKGITTKEAAEQYLDGRFSPITALSGHSLLVTEEYASTGCCHQNGEPDEDP